MCIHMYHVCMMTLYEQQQRHTMGYTVNGFRYLVSGTIMPNFVPWLEKYVNFDVTNTAFSQVSVCVCACDVYVWCVYIGVMCVWWC